MFPNVTLVLGGANSGKTEFAENLVHSSGLRPVYLATAQALDSEMSDKIARHRAQRGTAWHTHEEPLQVAAALAQFDADDCILLDCATMWLSNLMLADHDAARAQTTLIAAISNADAPLVVVSNEIGLGGIADNAMARRFAVMQGQLNQALAKQADLVVTIMAGLPMVLKGQMPGAGT